MSGSPRWPAACLLVVAMLGWSLPPVLIKYLKDAYDPFTQAFVRYGTGTTVLLLISAVWLRDDLRKALGRAKAIVPLTFVLLAQQVCWTMGCYGSTPVVAQLTTKLSVVFIILLSFMLFHEERAVIKTPWYLIGTTLSFFGVAATLMKDASSFSPVLDRYAVLLLLTAVFWGIYVVWAKHLVTDLHPVAMFAVLALFTTIGLGLLSVLFGEPHTIVTAGTRTTIIVVISGLIPIATAHPSYHYAQKRLGAAVSSSVNLLNPLGTYVFALFVFPDERLLPTQWAGAAVLLAGTLLVTLADARTRTVAPNDGQT